MVKEKVPSNTQRGTVFVPERLKFFDRTKDFAVLATDDNGQPYASLITYAFTPDFRKVIFATPRNTRKYKNILSAGYVALLIDNRSNTQKDIMDTEAITVTGTVKPVRKGTARRELASIYLKKHPELKDFVKASSTVLVVLEIIQCVHVGKFQTVSVWDCHNP